MTEAELLRTKRLASECSLAREALRQLLEEIEARPDQVPHVLTALAFQMRIILDMIDETANRDAREGEAAREAHRRRAA